jgi:transcriptional regulator with XRE-family HTH domain
VAHGRVKHPPLALLRPLAAALQVDPSLLYLLAHPEIPSFVVVRVADGAQEHRPSRAARFLDEPPSPAPRGRPRERDVVFERLGLSLRGHYRWAIDKYIHYDGATDELFIVLPSEEARREAEQLELRGRLRRKLRAAAQSQRSFFRASGISATAFRNVANGKSIPSERHLRFLREQLGVAEEMLLLWSLRRRCGDRLVPRVGPPVEAQGRG